VDQTDPIKTEDDNSSPTEGLGSRKPTATAAVEPVMPVLTPQNPPEQPTTPVVVNLPQTPPVVVNPTPTNPVIVTDPPSTTVPMPESILEDIYVKIYLARLRTSQVRVERIKQELLLTTRRRDRAEYLYRNNAISAQEVEIIRTEVEVDALRVREAEAISEEDQTFVDVAISRISLGQEMPICAELR
jgi:hypothetical protein